MQSSTYIQLHQRAIYPPSIPYSATFASPQFPESRIRIAALAPEGGASAVGSALEHYIETSLVDMAVVGSRPMGDIQRTVLGLVGAGSVSDHCVHNLKVPVLVHHGTAASTSEVS